MACLRPLLCLALVAVVVVTGNAGVKRESVDEKDLHNLLSKLRSLVAKRDDATLQESTKREATVKKSPEVNQGLLNAIRKRTKDAPTTSHDVSTRTQGKQKETASKTVAEERKRGKVNPSHLTALLRRAAERAVAKKTSNKHDKKETGNQATGKDLRLLQILAQKRMSHKRQEGDDGGFDIGSLWDDILSGDWFGGNDTETPWESSDFWGDESWSWWSDWDGDNGSEGPFGPSACPDLAPFLELGDPIAHLLDAMVYEYVYLLHALYDIYYESIDWGSWGSDWVDVGDGSSPGSGSTDGGDWSSPWVDVGNGSSPDSGSTDGGYWSSPYSNSSSVDQGEQTVIDADRRLIATDEDQILSYPANRDSYEYYPNDMDISWSIEAPADMSVWLRFDDIDVESGSPDCAFDVVWIWEMSSGGIVTPLGDGTYEGYPGMYCGFDTPSTDIRSTGNKVYVQFQSDYSVKYTGFDLLYKAV